MESFAPSEFQNWLPSKLFEKEGCLFLEWIYLWDVHFDKPFFDETLMVCKTTDSWKGNEQKGKRITSIDYLSKVAQTLDSINPSLFIFHTSRCGSTLTTQILSLDRQNIVFSEYPIIDAILRATIDGKIVPEEKREIWLGDLIKIMGQKRLPEKERLIIKLDSWHLVYHSLFREVYPDMPFAILYREPEEILFSNNKRRGIQFIPDIIPPSIYKIEIDSSIQFSLNEYANWVLQVMYAWISEIKSGDKNCLLSDYKNGMDKNLLDLIRVLRMDISFMDRDEIKERMKLHSKTPDIIFIEDIPKDKCLATRETIMSYNRIEATYK
jgi:hypothetical protein